MKLKPGLFQLIVIIMTLSLVTACGGNPTNQADCNHQPNSTTAKVGNQQTNDCQPNSSGSSRTGNSFRSSGGSSRTGNSFGSSGGSSSLNSGDSNSSSTKSRGGFGSFGRGSFGGG